MPDGQDEQTRDSAGSIRFCSSRIAQQTLLAFQVKEATAGASESFLHTISEDTYQHNHCNDEDAQSQVWMICAEVADLEYYVLKCTDG